MKNNSIFLLFLSNNFQISPFYNSNNYLINIQNSKFNNFFNILTISILTNFKKTIFSNFLNTICYLNNNLFFKLKFNTTLSFNYSLETKFINCLFLNCKSNLNSAGIYINNIQYSLLINKCGFYNMSITYNGYSASSIYCENSKNITLYYLCFDNCYSSNHGASYGIHSCISSILTCYMNYSLESNLGKNNIIPGHSSYLGSDNYFYFKYNNITDSKSNGWGCGYYFLDVGGNNNEISFSISKNLIGPSFSQHYSGTNYNLLNMLYINCSVTSSWIVGASTSYINFFNCYFINISNKPYYSGNGYVNFINSTFSNVQSVGATFNNCNFQYTSSIILINYFQSNLCWEDINNLTQKKKKFLINYLFNFLFLIIF